MTGYFDQHYVPTLSKPVMVIGLRSNTDLGYMCAKKLIKGLRAKRFSEYYSEWFPDLAFVNYNGLCRLPRWVFHESSEADPNLIILSGVTEVASEQPEAYYSTFNEILRFSKAFAVCAAYVLDGMISEEEGKGVRVAATSPKLVRRAQRHGAQIMKKVSLPPVSSMLLGLSRLYGLPATLIVSPMNQEKPSDSAVEAIYSFLCQIADLKV